jgi:hypothetical protein
MTKQDYKLSISAPVSASDAYDKIARVSEWWTKYVEGSARNFGDVFTVRFGENFGGTFVEFKITEAVPGSKVVWHVTNCYLPWLKDKTEWNDTNVVIEVSASQSDTTVTMSHEGLTPEVECFEACEQGWNKYIGQSLKQFLTDGYGMPK